MDIGFFAAHEQYSPRSHVGYSQQAENAGFDTVWTSDHLHPWWHSGAHCGAAWPWMATAFERTESVRIGTGVTPPIRRYHPGLIAQIFATLGNLYPGRVFCCLGTGEAMNEMPLGFDWPEYSERYGLLIDACEIIRKLWEGGFNTHNGKYWQIDTMKLYTLPNEPIPLYIAGNGPSTAKVAGRYADGFLTTIDDIDEYRETLEPALEQGAAEADRDPSEIKRIKHLSVSYDTDFEKAYDGIERWQGPVTIGFDNEIYDPREIEREAKQRARDNWDDWGLVTTDIDDIRSEIDRFDRAGFDEVELISASPDQEKFIKDMGASVLPEY